MLSWTWNNTLTFNNSDLSIEIGFTSNGQHFDRLSSQKVDGTRYFGYCNGATCISVYETNSQSTSSGWINSSFKNIAFDTLPNEQLMSILSANATVSKNVSKVEINGATLIDISNDTVAANILAEGYTAHDKTGNTITGTLTQQSGKTVTPGTSDVVAVENGKYTTGTVYVKGDSNLTADNIKSGTSIFGVTGTYEGSGGGYNLKTVSFTLSSNQSLKSYTINHNCGKIPKFVMVLSDCTNSSYLCSGCGENTQQAASFTFMKGSSKYTAAVTSTTFIFTSTGSTTIRYLSDHKYTFYFFY